MKRLFLTSSNASVMNHLVTNIPDFKKGMRCVFIPTAAEVEQGDRSWLDDDRRSLLEVGFSVLDFSVTGKNESEVVAALDQADAVMVSGGNTYFLLQELIRSQAINHIRRRVEAGMLYMGCSAGSIVAGPTIGNVGDLDDKSLAPDLTTDSCLGLTDVIVFPHWGSPFFERRYEQCMRNAYHTGYRVVLLTDDQYLHVCDDWYRIESV